MIQIPHLANRRHTFNVNLTNFARRKFHLNILAIFGHELGECASTSDKLSPFTNLHFHIMNRPSPIAADGIPYVIDAFDFSGQVDIAAFDAAPGLTGDWGKGRSDKPEKRDREFPLNLNIINFAPAVAPK